MRSAEATEAMNVKQENVTIGTARTVASLALPHEAFAMPVPGEQLPLRDILATESGATSLV
jgi:hypothetical protein